MKQSERTPQQIKVEGRRVLDAYHSTFYRLGWKCILRADFWTLDALKMGVHTQVATQVTVNAQKRFCVIKSYFDFVAYDSHFAQMVEGVNFANFTITDGCLEINPQMGTIDFKTVMHFLNSKITENCCEYTANLHFAMVDKLYTPLRKLNCGEITLQQFASMVESN